MYNGILHYLHGILKIVNPREIRYVPVRVKDVTLTIANRRQRRRSPEAWRHPGDGPHGHEPLSFNLVYGLVLP